MSVGSTLEVESVDAATKVVKETAATAVAAAAAAVAAAVAAEEEEEKKMKREKYLQLLQSNQTFNRSLNQQRKVQLSGSKLVKREVFNKRYYLFCLFLYLVSAFVVCLCPLFLLLVFAFIVCLQQVCAFVVCL